MADMIGNHPSSPAPRVLAAAGYRSIPWNAEPASEALLGQAQEHTRSALTTLRKAQTRLVSQPSGEPLSVEAAAALREIDSMADTLETRLRSLADARAMLRRRRIAVLEAL